MRRCGWIAVSVLLVGLGGCGDDSSSTTNGSSSSGETTAGPSTSTSLATTTGATGSSTGGGVSSSEGGSTTGSVDDTAGSGDSGSTGGNQACEDCVIGECNDELIACAGDDVCVCWLDCSETNTDEECLGLCGEPSPAWLGFVACYLAAFDVGAVCFEECVDPCGVCILTECNDEYDACLADDACACWFECDDETQDCGMLCGPPPPSWDAFATCYVGVVEPGGTCEPVCPM